MNSGIRHSGKPAGSPTIDTGGLTAKQLEIRIRENKKRVAGRAAAGVRCALQRSAPRVAELGEAPGGPVDK